MAVVLDRVVRYVNGDMITQREVLEVSVTTCRRAGATNLPAREALEAMSQQQLEELTKRRLMLQEAERIGVTIDRRLIRRQTLAWSEQTGLARTVDQRMAEAERRMDVQRVRAVLQFYLQHTPGITPNHLREVYAERIDSYTRPDRRRFLRIAVRPDDGAGLAAIRRDLMALFRDAGISPDPDVSAVVDDAARERVLAAEAGERDAVW